MVDHMKRYTLKCVPLHASKTNEIHSTSSRWCLAFANMLLEKTLNGTINHQGKKQARTHTYMECIPSEFQKG